MLAKNDALAVISPRGPVHLEVVAGTGVHFAAGRLCDATGQPTDYANGHPRRLPVRVPPAEHRKQKRHAGNPGVLGRRNARSLLLLWRAGVSQEYRDQRRQGQDQRLLDHVNLITGVSGGSFTALAYGLYGEKLFDDYETRFLKRDVQGEILSRTVNPFNWPKLGSTGYGRSELASQLYDEILFNGATFGDLARAQGPMILASATDLSTGARFVFSQGYFDVICSDLGAVHLSRAAAASSAVPVVLSPITLNNYGGTCNMGLPEWTKPFLDSPEPPGPRRGRCVRSRRRRPMATASTGPTFTSWTAAWRITSACAACSTGSRSCRRSA